ncbi:MAG: hypothetical protein ACPGU7_05850 [Gammaproteobacteria bacterium]
MLTFDDCVHFSNHKPTEIGAIAEHEHVNDVVACELAADLASTPSGRRTLIRYMVDDICHAEQHHNLTHAYELRGVLREYIAPHHYL